LEQWSPVIFQQNPPAELTVPVPALGTVGLAHGTGRRTWQRGQREGAVQRWTLQPGGLARAPRRAGTGKGSLAKDKGSQLSCSPPLSQPPARLSAPLPRPRRSSAPAYSSAMKRPLSCCQARDSDLVSPLAASSNSS